MTWHFFKTSYLIKSNSIKFGVTSLKGCKDLKVVEKKGCEIQNWGLRPGWQLRLNSVLQHNASYFMTWLTAWLVLSFLLHVFHLFLSLALSLFYWASLITGFSALSECLARVAITSVRQKEALSRARTHTHRAMTLFSSWYSTLKSLHVLSNHTVSHLDMWWTFVKLDKCWWIHHLPIFVSSCFLMQRHDVTFGKVLNMLVKEKKVCFSKISWAFGKLARANACKTFSPWCLVNA